MRRDENLAELTARHPAWQIWRVERYTGGSLWFARPWGRTKPVLHADTAKDLAGYIQESETGHACLATTSTTAPSTPQAPGPATAPADPKPSSM